MDEKKQARVAESESTFRDVNERIQMSHEQWGGAEPQEFLCECGELGCTERTELTLEEYEAIRADPARFAILPGHQISSVERVVEEHDRFWVVEKIGSAGEVAEARDPRTLE